MSIRVAVLGVGIMGYDHAKIIANDLSGVVLQVVCDASEERAKTVAKECGAVDFATDPAAVIDRDDVDAVIIATPDETHSTLSRKAMELGKPVLCEKPLAPTPKECLELCDVEMKMGRHLMQLGFMRRFDQSYAEMKQLLDNGDLGNAIMMHNYHRNVTAPSNFTGQMAITNSAPHEFDVARFVLGCEYTSISVFQPQSVDTTKTGAPVFMVLETNGGQLVNIEINNNASYGYDVRGELVGEKGSVFLNAPVHTKVNLALQAVERYEPDWRSRYAEAYRVQNKAWLHLIKTGEPSPIASNAWDGYCASVVAEAGVKALNSGQKVAIEFAEKPSFYNK